METIETGLWLNVARSSDPRIRFVDQIDAGDFFRQCPTTIDMPLIAYCNPTLNLNVRYIYLWCGRLAEVANAISNGLASEFKPTYIIGYKVL